MASMHLTTGEYKLIDDLSADIDRSTSEQQIGSDFWLFRITADYRSILCSGLKKDIGK